MAHLGGGAEALSRFKQYEYRANSSLVLTTDSRPRDTHEPTGEPETLWGKIDPKSFGDRAYRGKPPELEEKLKKSRKKKERDVMEQQPRKDAKRRKVTEESVLSLGEDGVYQPKTKETRAAYEMLLSVIQQQFGGQPQDVLSGAADEVLAVLKNEKFKNQDKKKEIEKLLNTISTQVFDQLVSIGKLITDYQDGTEVAGSAGAGGDEDLDDVGVAVEFEEDEDDDDESDYDQVHEESEGDDEDASEYHRGGAMQMGGIDDEDMEEAKEGMTLNVQDIDAYWLQRKISQAYGEIDPQLNQRLAEDVLQKLIEGDDRDIENQLLVLLDYDKFDLIKLLLRNRLKIVWCTRLARAEDQEQRKNIEDEMRDSGPSLSAILEQLHATRASAKESQKNLEKSIRKRQGG